MEIVNLNRGLNLLVGYLIKEAWYRQKIREFC